MFRTRIVVFVALYGAVFSDSLPHQTHDQTNSSTDHTSTLSLRSLNYTDAELSTFRDLVLATHVKELRKPQKKLENDKSRRKRSIFNLYSMIGCATDFSRLALLDYGNYCGWGGSGRPIDRIDRCCQRHDNCYEWVMYDYDKWTWSILFRSYKWYCNGGDPFCASYQDAWRRETCLCDLKFVKCLQRVRFSYDD